MTNTLGRHLPHLVQFASSSSQGRAYDLGSGRTSQLGGSPTAGALRAATLASATSRNGFGFAGHTVPTGGRVPLTRYASTYSVVHSLRP